MIGANILDVTYGIKVLPEHDPFIELAEAGQECIGECAVAGLHLVDIAPIRTSPFASVCPTIECCAQSSIFRHGSLELHINVWPGNGTRKPPCNSICRT